MAILNSIELLEEIQTDLVNTYTYSNDKAEELAKSFLYNIEKVMWDAYVNELERLAREL